MSSLAYQINVDSPCDGNQVVNKVSSTHYAGASGDFSYAILTRAPSDTAWKVVIYAYSDPNSGCYPTKTFEQVTPDANDPAGTYYGWTSSGPDQSEGELAVAEWP